MWNRSRSGLIAIAALTTTAAVVYLMIDFKDEMKIKDSKSLNHPINHDLSYDIVFTSRTEATSLEPKSPESEPYREPVQVPWSASQGRLRLLDRYGRLFELTWGRVLPDGASIVDVMSPSVSLDGKRILFAGRSSTNPRWRIYEIQSDGSGLRNLTGGPDDAGCIAIPPLRFRADGSRISDPERMQIDYDDIDPTDLGPNGFAFASSRLPDLGRDHSRRATQIWTWAPQAKSPQAITANRNNDRWPVLIGGDQILFSLWSRNREAVTADLSELKPVSAGGEFATHPTDNWMASVVMTNAAQFGYAIKSVEPVWRPRPLFNGRIAFMTSTKPNSRLRLAQADWGYIRTAPSSLPAGQELPYEGGAQLYFGPDRDKDGRELITGSPSAAPDHSVLFAASPNSATPASFGIYEVSDDWTSASPVPKLIFDDPELVDSEPVAIYTRRFNPEPRRNEPPVVEGYKPPKSIKLVSGEEYKGAMGYLENIAMSTAIRNPIPWHDRSNGVQIDPRDNPLVSPPPNVTSVAVYSANRDRFDHPDQLRVIGSFEKTLVLPVVGKDDFSDWIPSDPLKPSVLVGQDENGKVARWKGVSSKDYSDRNYFAYAGDHYSGVGPNSYNYCNGCHTGHTYTVVDPKERTGKSWNNLLPK